MSDEVSDFLRSVEELKERREQEDEARSRELEEKFLQERAERQARRAERARSISPQKASPANTPPPASRSSISGRPIDGFSLLASSPKLNSPRSPSIPTHKSSDSMDGTSDFANEIDSMFDGESSNRLSGSGSMYSMGVPSRAPLSWARRPTSQSSERPSSRNRPLSVVAAENAAARTSSTSAAEQPQPEQTPSRDQISQALAGKDPSWFRQTADRGQSSAAYRRNQVEDPDTLDMSSLRTQLPGMSRESSAEPTRETRETRETSNGPASPPARFQNKQLASPLVLSPAQRLEPPAPTREPSEEKDLAAGGRSSPTRPISPTKGMGGFVQSAMMKRSDSVKRWSVNSPAGLQRADSVVASRPGHTRSKSMLREGSTTPTTSRPTSSHEPREREPAVQEKPDVKEKPEVQKKPAVKEVAKEVTPEAETKPDEEEIPVSPTKTMDPRRWSPTKSSWLDAQLNKPESPKAKQTPPTSHQPAWMVELNKAKAQKATVGGDDIDRSASVARKHEVKTGGLMRAPPMGIGVKPNSNGSGPLSPRLPSDDKTSNVSSLRGNLVKRLSETNMNEGGAAAVTAKIKPATPPKKDLDFRGNLKPRQAPAAGTSGPPDEFKNVFGGLRRTKTQNYVAPDELKNNILRGKAGLNNTGGPKPSERKDEFKEAILKKKEDFKKAQQEGHSVTKSPPLPQEKPALPEALAKKLEIKRSATVSKRELPSSNAASESLTGLGITAPNRSSTMSSFSKPEPETARPLPSPKLISAENEPPVMPTLHKEVSAPARLQGGLANRFNPALANILARGPPGAGAAPPKPSVEPASQTVAKETEPEASSGPGPKLTHMTKSRARGPKRKAPSSAAKVAEVAKSASSEASPVPALAPAASRTPIFKSPPLTQQERFEPKFETPKVSDPVKQDKPFPTPKSRVVSPVVPAKKFTLDKTPNISPLAERISLIDSSKKASEEDSKPASTPVFKPRARSPTKVADQIAALAAKSQDKTAEKKEESVSRPASPTKNVLKRISKFIDEPVPQQVGSPADTNKSLPPSPTKSLPPSPVKHRALPKPAPAAAAAIADKKKVDDEKVAAEPVVSVKNGRDLFGGNSASVFGVPTASKSAAPAPASAPATVAEPEPVSKVLPQRPRTPPRQLPQLSTRPLPAPPLMSPSLGSPNRSPMTKYNMEVNAMLTDFFGHARPQRTYNVDAAEILTHRPQTESTTTTRQAQLFQISADGKKVPVPGQHERVLFEREMYLCTHTFTSASTGKSASEVFFWTGDEVPSSATQDAHLFAQREARSFGGKLIKLTQGKETPEFLQALGGIVTIRRGSSNKYDSLAPVMLCGRRYHGQIVFDEVDFLPASLCSGFPYLIAQQGKCTLWKGKGSDVDELSCARLIGMDLALMSELEEVEDGEEPASFWDIFPSGGSRQGSADHWRLKPSYDRYCGRLFRSDARDRKQIIELTPFTQSDLLSSSIYILDAFFEMYIIVGARAQDQYASFHNALEFAQEYAILASGMEDRPFVPVCTVVLEGIPRDLKSVFRKWTDGRSPTVMHPPSGVGGTGLKRGRSLRVVPLNQALQALRE